MHRYMIARRGDKAIAKYGVLSQQNAAIQPGDNNKQLFFRISYLFIRKEINPTI